MSWTMLVPLKPPGTRKQRLAGVLDSAARDALADRMLAHVAGVLAGIAGVRTVLLAATPPIWWRGAWQHDAGGGLNAALAAARDAIGVERLAILHADLPYLAPDDIAALLTAAEAAGCAIAPDHAGTGTNALAIADARPFRFAFGTDSFAAHRAAAGTEHAVVRRRGLALDIDTAEDWAALARSAGTKQLQPGE